MEKSVTRFAIIGYGRIGKRHRAIIDGQSEAQLVSICDVKDRNDLLSSTDPLPYYHQLEVMLAEGPGFDVLCIATPNGLHAAHALSGLKAGKHVVIEKPMALSQADCEAVIYEALRQSKQVFCVMQNRYSPPSVWLKSLMEEGILGKILQVQISCFWNRDQRYYTPDNWHGSLDLDGGTLFTQFSHFVDMMYWLFGDITNIQAKFANLNHKGLIEFEDSGQIQFDFQNGGIGSFDYSTSVWDQNLESSLTIIAEKGSVKVSGQYMNEVVRCHIDQYAMPELPPSEPPNDYGQYKGSAANHHFIFQNVIDTLHHRDTIGTNALEGLKVVGIIERMYAARNLKKLSE